MTARYRVLRSMSVLKEFTAFDIARHAGVALPTVRTVIDRERYRLEDTGREEAAGRGGRWRRFRIDPAKLESLQQELRWLGGDVKAVAPPESPDPEMPTSLAAAEEYLTRRIFAQQSDRAEILKRERYDLDICWRLIDASPPHEKFGAKLNILEGLWHIYTAGLWESRAIEPLIRAVSSLASSGHEEAQWASSGSQKVEQSLDEAAALDYFLELKANERVSNQPENDAEKVRQKSAYKFRQSVWTSQSSRAGFSQIAKQLIVSKEIKTPVAAIRYVGCDPRSYRDDAVRVKDEVGGKSLILTAREFTEDIEEVDDCEYPLTAALKSEAAMTAVAYS